MGIGKIIFYITLMNSLKLIKPSKHSVLLIRSRIFPNFYLKTLLPLAKNKIICVPNNKRHFRWLIILFAPFYHSTIAVFFSFITFNGSVLWSFFYIDHLKFIYIPTTHTHMYHFNSFVHDQTSHKKELKSRVKNSLSLSLSQIMRNFCFDDSLLWHERLPQMYLNTYA